MNASGLQWFPFPPRFTERIADLLGRGSAIRCSLHGLGIAPNIKESVVKGVLLSSPSPRLRMFRANESHANEAGVVVNGFANQGMHVVEKGVRNASSAQKDFWNLALRTIDRINANRAY